MNEQYRLVRVYTLVNFSWLLSLEVSDSSLCAGRRWWRQEEVWVMSTKNFLEISSLRAAKEVRFATKRIELYDIPRVKDWNIIWMARFWSASRWSVWVLVKTQKWIDSRHIKTKMIIGPFYTYRRIHFTPKCFVFDNLCNYLIVVHVAVATWPCTDVNSMSLRRLSGRRCPTTFDHVAYFNWYH